MQRKNLQKKEFLSWTLEIGRRSREIREDLGLSQMDMLSKIGIEANDPSVASRFERGSSRLNAEYLYGLVDLAEQNNYSVLWLITGRGKKMDGKITGGIENISDKDLIREIINRKLVTAIGDYIAELQSGIDNIHNAMG